MKRSRGEFSGFTRKLRAKRRLTPSDFVKSFSLGEKVRIVPYPNYKVGKPPHKRYRNRVGVIVEKRGDAYVVEVKDGGKIKKIIAHPIHLQRVE
jgi:large subunit ribosomal protein L21e